MTSQTVRAVFAGALAAAAFAGGPALAQNITIGAVLPMTGDLQAYGATSANGVRLAIDEINDQGGVMDKQLELVIGDSQTTPQAGVDAAQKLVSVQDAAGLVGAMSSGVTIPVAESVSSSSKVPQISNASTSPVITTLDDDGYLFRTVPSDALQGVVLGDVVYDKGGLRTVSTMYVNNDYGEGLANEFAKRFEKLGGKVVASLPFEQGKASYRGELAQAAEGDAEALVLIAYPENGVTILRQALEEGHFEKFVFTDGMKAPEVAEAIGGDYLDGSIGTSPAAAADSEAAKYFKQAYEETFGELPPKPFIDSAYDATYLLALAIEKAGSTEGAKVRDALSDVATPPGVEVGPGEWEKAKQAIAAGEDVNYEGVAGSHDFDSNGDVPGTFAHWTFEGDTIETVELITPSM